VEDAFAAAQALVEKVIARLGLDPKAVRAKASEAHPASYALQRGSASILVSVIKPHDTVHVRVIAPVMTLPDGDKRDALFRRLLELNAAGIGNAAFGLLGDRVVALSERPSAGLDDDELTQMIRHLGALADTYDDRLVKEFGGKLASEKS
jgi:hypothetical protein